MRVKPLSILLRCEIASISRCRAFRVAALAHVVALTLAASGWGMTNPYARMHTLESLLLMLLLPWVGARCAAAERGDRLVIFSAILGVQPSRILIARVLAIAGALVVIVLTGAPFVIVANRIAAGPMAGVVRFVAGQATVALIAAAAVVIGQYVCAGRVQAWLAATVSTVAISGILQTPPSDATAAFVLVLCGAAIWALATRADVSLRYLSEGMR